MLKKGVTEAELDKAKNRFLTGKLLERETANGKASALGEAAVIYGDATRVNTDLAKLQAVTTAQIKEVLNKYITGKKKVVIEYLPESMKAASQENEPRRRARKSPDEDTHHFRYRRLCSSRRSPARSRLAASIRRPRLRRRMRSLSRSRRKPGSRTVCA